MPLRAEFDSPALAGNIRSCGDRSLSPGSAQPRRRRIRSVAASSAQREGTESQTVDVAFIGGFGRSGSTVLALLLGKLPGFVPVGGLTNLWERGLQKNYLCGCGSHFRDCPFWSRVGQEAFGGWENLDVDEILRLKRAATRYRHLIWLVAPRARSAHVENLNEYSSYVTSVYRAVTRVSGRSIVVDNSHDTPLGFFLHKAPDIRARIVHLVRDSRGVAFSLSKQMLRPEATAGPTYMERYSAAQAGLEWALANLPYHARWSSSLPRIRIYYESLVASPVTEIARIAEFFGSKASPSELSLFADDSIDIPENHMMSGNPHRLGRRQIQLRLDDEWRTKMRPTDRRVVTLVTSPLALAYGYLGGRRPRQARSGSKVQSG
jgi:hypothetical protein